jgi:ArsR family transcriptional regulator, zinc-responsive transcriptional repressor
MHIKNKPARSPKLTSLEVMDRAAALLRTLAHSHRLRMVQMLLRGRYMVGELAEACGIPSHMASEHLRLMERCGLLTCEKEGRKAYYQITEPNLVSMISCIEEGSGPRATEVVATESRDAGRLQGLCGFSRVGRRLEPR